MRIFLRLVSPKPRIPGISLRKRWLIDFIIPDPQPFFLVFKDRYLFLPSKIFSSLLNIVILFGPFFGGYRDYKSMKPYIDIVDEIKASEMTKMNFMD